MICARVESWRGHGSSGLAWARLGSSGLVRERIDGHTAHNTTLRGARLSEFMLVG
jgi:hypothetical protein